MTLAATQPLSDLDRSVLRACGYPIPADPISPPTAADAVLLALRVLANPSARMVSAAAVALLYAVKHDLRMLPVGEFHPDALQRAGFLLEHLAANLIDQPVASAACHALAGQMRARASRRFIPIPLNAGMSRGLFARLQDEPDPVRQAWLVFGRPELPG